MGYCKVVDKGNGKVVFVHQLGMDGEPYAEDVTIEAQKGVPPTRVDWSKQDGQVGTISWSFTPTTGDTSSIKFPED
jgi:hypothetical protein